jgi:predicted MFS family arabinose efflux permease
MTIPVWCCAGLFIITFGILSDRMKKRGWFVIASFAIASIGWIILLASKSKWVDFVGTLFIGSGTLPTVVLTQAWMNSNMLGYTKKYHLSVPFSPF